MIKRALCWLRGHNPRRWIRGLSYEPQHVDPWAGTRDRDPDTLDCIEIHHQPAASFALGDIRVSAMAARPRPSSPSAVVRAILIEQLGTDSITEYLDRLFGPLEKALACAA